MTSRILIIAFDGLDYELIGKFNLDNIVQKEFGKIDNRTGISTIVTSELFASFLTGENYEEHGVVGLDRYKNSKLEKIERLNKISAFRKFKGLRRSIYANMPLLNAERRHVSFEDLRETAFLDKIPNSKDIGVRAYSQGYSCDVMKVLTDYGLAAAEEELDRFTKWKKWELFDEMEKDHDLIMAHFHKPDHIHHWYWEVGKMDKVEETYREMDEFAGEILEKAEENGFDTVIFMSDHGLPDVENGGHNENAFYSCKHELFGDKTPHITDFHDKILELADQEDEELDGIDL